MVLATGAGVGWLWAALGVLMTARLVPLWRRFDHGAWAVTGATRSTTSRAVSIEMAKPMFDALAVPLPAATAVLMPITSPAALTSGPPELPELMAASVWMRPSSWPDSVSSERSVAETMPWVTVRPPSSAERVADGDDVVADLQRRPRSRAARRRGRSVSSTWSSGEVGSGVGARRRWRCAACSSRGR